MNVRARLMGLAVLWSLVRCTAPSPPEDPTVIHYVGSSTVALFLRDADIDYAPASFDLDTDPESAGGERAILEGRADLAGVATEPLDSTLASGVEATCIGFDAIAVLVHPDNPLRDLARDQLARIFCGEVRNWSELGGPDLEIEAFVVGPESATRCAFRRSVMGAAEYGDAVVVRPDSALVDRVAAAPGGIAAISASFARDRSDVSVLQVDGRSPLGSHEDYPIVRPLYLLWWPGREGVRQFVEWTKSQAGQVVVERRFVSIVTDSTR